MTITQDPKVISLKVVTSQLYYNNYYEMSDIYILLKTCYFSIRSKLFFTRDSKYYEEYKYI